MQVPVFGQFPIYFLPFSAHQITPQMYKLLSIDETCTHSMADMNDEGPINIEI